MDGYDDSDTVALKKARLVMCFGGTMVWSVDFNSELGGKSLFLPTDHF